MLCGSSLFWEQLLFSSVQTCECAKQSSRSGASPLREILILRYNGVMPLSLDLEVFCNSGGHRAAPRSWMP
ncbi:hypothetical protein BDY21DRAFT_349286 [Lineolata rhizophorae]|uniref:Secreted protein n=1 Tax=Lineolata rhizophorae TaxID=578093 RepID=A0A6A6NWV5_9PEZI|nr:hypothetical protein BDY21DRAFT_349286 [Lineolata rhizophorae]